MKAEELRIGNYVYDTLGKVNKIDLEAITYIVKEPHNQVKPIPITEEWLLKFGFYYQASYKNYVVKSKQENNNSIKKIDGDWCYNNDYSDGYFVAELKYIHQLQNLYYALNQEELICK